MEKTVNQIKVQFLGAAGTVTGSKYLIEMPTRRLLIDCGLFQGLKELRLLNWQNLPVDAATIDDVILTHGHLDHVGYLPLLVKQGFHGNIYATEPTVEIAKLILLDSAKIQEEDAERANRFRYSKHEDAKPLYDTDEAEAVFPLFYPKPLKEWIDIGDNISFRFRYNGHILGASFIELKMEGKLMVFSGDIGRMEDPLLYTTECPEEADVLFIESTYGNRLHPVNSKKLLADEINKAAGRHGTIIIPSFAVERTQLLMHLLWELNKEKQIPPIPIYMDSPMGSHVLELFQRHLSWHKLSVDEATDMCRHIKIVQNQQETEELIQKKTAKIIIASSGMATGGRVLSYFEHYLGDSHATILLAGYQGEGTRGRALLDGASEIKMRGKFWPVKAEIAMIEGLSAHADQSELIHWLSKLKQQPAKLFIVHGEKDSALALSEKIKQTYHWESYIPKLNQTIIL
ncbi:MAG: MBL fold metallo-hydrolase [Bacteroidetes bacterium]|nr:MBL fold metallo-hydrolase [Bacteroidota bacterium]